MNEEEIETMKAYLDNPPSEHARVCFMYRQAIGGRQQAEARVAAARAALKAAQDDLGQAGADLNMALGVERGLHEAVVALMNPTDNLTLIADLGTQE
jgi:hypothetical protein